MHRNILLGSMLLAGGVGLVAKSQAQTVLINFPIADTLKHREGLYIVGASGYARNVSQGFTWGHTLNVGLYDRVELGVANDFMGNTVYGAKIQLVDDPKRGYAASFGIANYNTTTHINDAFFCFRKDFKNFRLHATAYRSQAVDSAFGVFGADFAIAKGWSGAIEYKTGTDNQTWVAATSPELVKNLTITLASRMPWDGGAGPQYQVLLNYGFRF